MHLRFIKPILTTNEQEWQQDAQSFELEFHKKNLFRQSDAFMEETAQIFESFGFSSNQFAGKTVIDIGAGSRLRGRFFQNSDIIAIEPLAAKFMAEISWCDLSTAKKVFSEPAEVLIPEITGSADLVFSLNVLDHCFDFNRIVSNALCYLKQDGFCFFSFDSHLHVSKGHPLILTESACRKTFVEAGFKIINYQLGFSPEYQKQRGRNGYDGNSPCLNFWLGKQ